MLACTQNIERHMLKDLRWPKLGSHKFDGVRMRTVPANDPEQEYETLAISRKGILIPNAQIIDFVDNYIPDYFDGEIVIEGKSFHEIQSIVMTANSVPFSWQYYVFDFWDRPMLPFLQRLQDLEDSWDANNDWIQVTQVSLANPKEALEFEEQSVVEGYEGIILRDPDAPYKPGRSTLNQEWMLKMKRFEDREAIIIDFIEKKHNTNKATLDNTGYTKRSKHQAGMIGAATLGALVVKDLEDGQVFEIGSGWNSAQGLALWENRGIIKRRKTIITYKCQTHGRKDKPRSAIFKGIRYD